ncbi:MAG: hypothetical protein LBS35_08145 [Synergistaceae bacterium]|nr:hypothetical protein [Synergistaceae bacterium]
MISEHDEHERISEQDRYERKLRPADNYHSEYEGTSVNFKFTVYSVLDINAEELKRDGRDFAIPMLAAKKMLEAGGDPLKRGEYSLDILEMIKDRVSDKEKAKSFRNFAQNILEIDKMDIDPKVKEAWKMQFRPLDEVVRDIYIHEAKEEGIFETVQTLLKNGLPTEQVARGMGLTLEELGELRQRAELKPARTGYSSLEGAGTDSRSPDSA